MPRKVLGVGGSSLAALSDNGTVVTSTEVLRLPDGTSAAPSISATSSTATGIFFSSNRVGITSNNGVAGWIQLAANSGGVMTGQSNIFGWLPSDTIFAQSVADLSLGRRAAANMRMGASDLNGTPVDQTVSVQNAITGSDLPGGHFTIDAPLGTGLGAASKISINRAIMKATGTTAQTSSNAFAVGQTKTLSNTSATAQTIATITLGSNAGGGCSGIFTIVATDGTNFDSETQSFNVSFVNKATVVTVGTPAITASTAAVNSGTTSLGITAVANGNNVDIKVTPVFGTIVPTTVTLWPIITHSTGTVTFS